MRGSCRWACEGGVRRLFAEDLTRIAGQLSTSWTVEQEKAGVSVRRAQQLYCYLRQEQGQRRCKSAR
jgi:hypothetical protein